MRPPGLVARRVTRSITALATATIAVVLVAPTPGSAHTDIDFTMPTDGAAVGEPVTEITVAFTDPVTLVGPGFEVLDPAGDVLTPVVATDDDQVFLLQIDPPLAGGEAAVRFEVRAEDGHTITGGFSFTVAAEAPTTTSAPTTAPPTTTASPDTTALAAAPATQAPTTAPTASGAPESSAAPVATEPDPIGTDAGSTTPERESDDAGSSSGLYVAIATVIAIAAGAYLVVRSRTSPRG